jgi:hypothetical protein
MKAIGFVLAAAGSSTVAPPAQPTGLSATPITTARIDLAWTDAATTETAYKVYRSTDGVAYSQVGTDQAAGTQAYSDTTISAGVKYYYKVAAVNAGGETLSDAATANTLTLSLVAYWKMDEASDGSGNVTRNDSVNTSHLTSVNTIASGTGKISNGALLVAASDERFTVASNANLVMGNIDFSMAFWIKFTSLGAAQTVLRKQAAANNEEYYFVAGTDSKIAFGLTTAVATWKEAKWATALSTGVWYLVIGWHDATADTVNIIVNNASAVSAATANGTPATSTNALFIGSLSDGTSQSLDAILDEMGFWKRVLTADERTALHNGGAGNTYPF